MSTVRSLVFIESTIKPPNLLLMQAEVYNGNLFPVRQFKDLPTLWTKSEIPRTETLVKNNTKTHPFL